MTWDGTERRRGQMQPTMTSPMTYCDKHIEFAEKISAIHTSVANIEKGLCEDSGFKKGIFIAFVSTFVVIVIQIAMFAFLFGQMSRQITVNTARLDRIEVDHQRMLLK